ncbi:hypothetical protein ACIOG7_36320 [Streptomyces sp. NPDC087894]|uniref:hypothetical protein n=1 Tax=Streptomyces sp. NPDC087894 TaxID=3365816 RepID=UPI00380251C9
MATLVLGPQRLDPGCLITTFRLFGILDGPRSVVLPRFGGVGRGERQYRQPVGVRGCAVRT